MQTPSLPLQPSDQHPAFKYGIHGQGLETGKADTWKYLGDLKWFHNKCGQSHLMYKPCRLAAYRQELSEQ